MKFPILVRRNQNNKIYLIVVPDFGLKFITSPEIENPKTLFNQLNLSYKLKSLLSRNQRLAASIVASEPSNWLVKARDNDTTYEWHEFDVKVDKLIKNRCLYVSNKVLPGFVLIVFIFDIGFGIYLDLIVTQVTADVTQGEAIASGAVDILSAIVLFTISQTLQNMYWLNKKILGRCSRCDDDKVNADKYSLEDDFENTSTRKWIISNLKSWKTYPLLVLGAGIIVAEGYNFYVNTETNYNVVMQLVEEAKDANLTSLSLETLESWASLDFYIGQTLQAIITAGEYLVAAYAIRQAATKAKSYISSFNCFGFFSRENKNSPEIAEDSYLMEEMSSTANPTEDTENPSELRLLH